MFGGSWHEDTGAIIAGGQPGAGGQGSHKLPVDVLGKFQLTQCREKRRQARLKTSSGTCYFTVLK